MRRITIILFGWLCAASGAFAQVPGVTAGAIRLGQSAPLTGPASALGTEMRLGATVYFDAVNAHGGIHGRNIELVSLDDGYEPARTEANTRALIDEQRVFALFGYVGTPTSLAALPVFTAARVPFVAPFTGAEALRNPPNRYAFHLRASYYDETEEIVRFMVEGTQRRIAVFYQDDSFGEAGLAGVERALSRRDLKTVATGKVKRNTTDVGAAAKAIAAAHPDGVIMISAYASCAEFVRQAKRAGYSGRFYSVSFVGSKALADALQEESYGLVISQVVPLPWDVKIPVVKEYQQLMQKAGAREFSFTSFEGFLAAKVLAEALRDAGRDLTRERLITSLERLHNVDLGGFNVGFGPGNHVASQFVELTLVGRQGKFTR